MGGNANFPQERLEQTYQFQNVSSYILSSHSLKFGFDLARTKLVSNLAANSKGTWVFSNLQNFLNNQSFSLNYLASAPSRYQFHQLRQAYFVQDDIKARRNLTVNIGLRYETSAVPLGMLGATLNEVLNAAVPGPTGRDRNNWAPRLGFSFSPEFESGLLGKVFGNGQSAIRGGFGVGYDVLNYSLLAQVASVNYPGVDTQSFTGGLAPIDSFPTLPPRVTTPTLTSSTGFVNVPRDAQNPASHYWSLSVQRQINSGLSAELGYTGNRSYHLIRQDQANPGNILTQAKTNAVIAGCTAANLAACQDPAGFLRSPSNAVAADTGRIDSRWGSRTLLATNGNASYNAVYVQVNARTPFGLRYGANYTFSANLSDSEEFSNDGAASNDAGLSDSSPQVPQNYLDRKNEWGRSVFDRPHRATVNYSYELPWFRSSPGILNYVFKGWQWSGITEIQSGQPFTIRIGVDAVGIGSVASARPNYNPGGIFTRDAATGNLRTFKIPLDGTGIVTAPFVTNATTGAITFLRNSLPTGGTLGRNTFRGPGYANFNMSISKKFSLPGDVELQIRGDFINVFNHDNFPNPNAVMNATQFGTQTKNMLTDARQVLIGGKLAF